VLSLRGPSRKTAAVSAGVALVYACTFSRELRVLPHALGPPLSPAPVNSINAEEQLERGWIPEVQAFLTTSGGHTVPAGQALRLLGQALLDSGDFAGAEATLARAIEREPRPALRADALWMLSQAAYWRGDFAESARLAKSAAEAGRSVPPGWISFLASGTGRTLYGGAETGARTRPLLIRFGRPSLPRLDVKVNDRSAGEMILDSGATLSLLTESAASRLGVELVQGAVTSFRGLHRAELKMRLGWARSLSFGGVTLRDVPFGILPDGTLTFESEAVGVFSPPGVLGVHLMKEFDWRFEFEQRRVQAIRVVPAASRSPREQNVFFRRLRPMVRVSFNGRPWSLFLLDTGSEATMVTPAGLKANRFEGYEPSAPITLEGIGQSRVSWSKVSNLTLGISKWAVWFRNLVVNEGSEGIGDGVIGMSFLAPFDAELRFSSMTLTLERAGERRARDAEPWRPPGASPEPGS